MMFIPFAFIMLFLIPGLVFGQTIPTGTTITSVDILDLMQRTGGFLIAAGGILATIVIVITGFMYMLAGSNQQKVTSVKSMFKAGIIGALIIFGTGIIINTVRSLATNPLGFFQ